MGSAKETGGAAFPVMPSVDSSGCIAFSFPDPDPGMTLRDHFAGLVLQGLMVNAVAIDQLPQDHIDAAAQCCYMMADAMLRAREQP